MLELNHPLELVFVKGEEIDFNGGIMAIRSFKSCPID